MTPLEHAARLVAAARHLVAFTGAGISTESGLPDFRGPEGVWTRRDQGRPPPRSPGIEAVRPNPAHRALVELQELGLLAHLTSQNVDDLHRRSGIEPGRLAELHGNSRRSRCQACERTFAKGQTPRVCGCGGTTFRSSVINFGDSLPRADLAEAERHAGRADVYLVVGSSLLVTPAADLPVRALESGAALVLVNMGSTPLDGRATVRLQARAGEVLPALVARVRELREGPDQAAG